MKTMNKIILVYGDFICKSFLNEEDLENFYLQNQLLRHRAVVVRINHKGTETYEQR